MRCLHCGKRLSLLRKLSDGEFCSADHRALFERLNNDLGLQRLIASQSGLDREKPKLQKKPARQLSPENQIAAKEPPLGNLAPVGKQGPVAVRQVNQPGLPPLLGPKESAIPQPGLRARARGFAETAPIEEGVALEKPVAPLTVQPPQPIVTIAEAAPPSGADLAPDVDLLPVQEEVEQAPARVESLRPIAAGRVVSRVVVLREPRVTGSWRSPSDTSAPRLSMRMRPPSRECDAAMLTPSDTDRLTPAPLVELREIEAGGPLRAVQGAVLGVPGGAISAEVKLTAPQSGARHRRAGLRGVGQVKLRGRASGGRRAVHSGAAPAAPEIPPALEPRLALTTEAGGSLEVQPEMPVGLSAFAAFGGLRRAELLPHSFRPAEALIPGLRGGVGEPSLGMGGTKVLEVPGADILPCWRETEMRVFLGEPPATVFPRAGLKPQVPTVGESLEPEVMSLAPEMATETQQPAEPDEQAPPLYDSQRKMSYIRPLERALEVAGSTKASMAPVWAQALETAALGPRLKLKIDHADGSGSRAARVEWRARGGKERFRLAPEKIPGGRFWHSAPADLKWIALALPLILALVVWSFRGSVAPVEASLPQQPDASKTVIAKQMNKFQQVLLSRAAVRLFDDFRGGLGAWQGREGWAKTWKYSDSSFLEPGDLAIYTPTLDMRDYTMEFLGQIERRSLNWVFRAKDTENYYAIRIVITKGGPLPAASVVRYRVVGGKESGLVTLPLPISIRPDTVYRVRMDVRGRQFTTYVQGQVVDTFEDDRLTEGGVGFWSPKGDRSLLRWVEVMHQYDYLGRLCALLAPYPLQPGGQQAD
jgi:hypothetical protein